MPTNLRTKISVLALLLGLAPAVAKAADVDSPGFLKAQIYDNITGTAVDGLLADPSYPATPTRTLILNGLTFGEPAFGNTLGDNYGIRITGSMTVPTTGDYDVFIRSDDASRFFLNTTGTTTPDPTVDTPIAEETGCCNAFLEPGASQTTQAPISLVAGKFYPFLFLVKEGGGGDWGQVAIRKVGDTTPAGQLPPLRGALVAGKLDPTGASVTITGQPTNVTVQAVQKASFSVAATTVAPLTNLVAYQWYKNGVIIPGANSSSYSIASTAAADNSAKFKVMVMTPGASATSAEATLTVTPDTTAPTVLLVGGSENFTDAFITFSEPVTDSTATNKANYTVSGGLTVSAVTGISPTQVKITTSKQTAGASYDITINNVKDPAGNSVAANTKATLAAFNFQKGGLRFKAWNGIGGTAVDSLTADDRYISDTPDVAGYVKQFTSRDVWPSGPHDNYGGKLSGWIVPRETAQYEFFLRSDDASRLFLSPDDQEANAIQIAEETGCCNPFMDPGAAQTSEPQALVAGKRYAIYALWKEGGGGDYCDVAWRKLGDTAQARTLPYIPGDVLETLGSSTALTLPTVSITSPTAGSSFTSGTAVTITANATAGAGKRIALVEFFDQAQKIGEATSAPFTLTVPGLSDDAHVLIARATDNEGLFVDSAPVGISLGSLVQRLTIFKIGDTNLWTYDRSGDDLGTAWKDPKFDDSKWPKGRTLIADESTTTVEKILTPISRFNDAGVHVTTFYYRTHFRWDSDPAGVKLKLRHAVDDGAVFYLNGVEVLRFGIAAGAAFDFSTFFADHENAYEGPVDISSASLLKGDNVFAVEVHQTSSGSSDTVFGAELTATINVVPVSTTLFAIGDSTLVKYDRSGDDLGTNWNQRAFDDSKWPSGKTLIADESTTTVEKILTPISRFNDANVHVTTFYYRTHFNVDVDPSAIQKLRLRHVVDDGAVFYINGVEVLRFGIAAGAPFDFSTFFADHENAYEGPIDLPTTSVVRGDNLFAAEVHQTSSGSSDTVYGAELKMTVLAPVGGTTSTNQPKLTITRSGANLSITWTEGGSLQSADQVQGPWANVANATTPFSATTSGTRKFYRVSK